jgi:hypothetical protein
MTIQFWLNDPTIIFNKEYIFEIWPTNNMCYEAKLNAITRLIIFISILGYILTKSIKILIVSLITLVAIIILFKMRKPKIKSKEGFSKESYNNDINNYVDIKNTTITNPETLETTLVSNFQSSTKKNPFGNVLLTEIMDNPDRKSAQPCFNPQVEETITKNIKKSVQMMNPEIKNTNKQLYSSLYDNFELDQSNRIFFSTANTRVCNDQGAFGEFLYGNMPSSKESNTAAAIQREKDSYRYTLY